MHTFFLRLKLWIRITGNTKLTIVNPSQVCKRFFLCRGHFEEGTFNFEGNLKPTSIPTVFASPSLSDTKFQNYQDSITKSLGMFQSIIANEIMCYQIYTSQIIKFYEKIFKNLA